MILAFSLAKTPVEVQNFSNIKPLTWEEKVMKLTNDSCKLRLSFIVTTLVLAIIAISVPTRAHAPAVALSGFGTATIEGVIGQ